MNHPGEIRTFCVPQDLGQASDHKVYGHEEGTVVSYLNQRGASRQRVLMCAPTLVYVRRGTKRLELEGKPRDVTSGNLVLIDRGLHLMTEILDASTPYASTLICLKDKFLRELAARYPEARSGKARPLRGVHVMTPGIYLAEILDRLPGLLAHTPNPRILALKIEETMLAMQSPRARSFWATAIQGALVEGDAKLRSVVERHSLTPVTTAELATLSGRSLSTFKRDFRRIYATPPGKWLLMRRLEHARDLLSSRTCNVTEACWRSGFEDVSSFIRAFRRTYKTTPKQFQLQA